MRSLAVVIGVIVIIVLLVSSGTLGGAICVRSVGCLYSTDGGVKVDNQQTVQVSAGP